MNIITLDLRIEVAEGVTANLCPVVVSGSLIHVIPSLVQYWVFVPGTIFLIAVLSWQNMGNWGMYLFISACFY